MKRTPDSIRIGGLNLMAKNPMYPLNQTAEECAELTKECLKYVRIVGGDSNKSLEEVTKNIVGEMADMLNQLDSLAEFFYAKGYHNIYEMIEEERQKKLLRWEGNASMMK